jgi:hypothetical protein
MSKQQLPPGPRNKCSKIKKDVIRKWLVKKHTSNKSDEQTTTATRAKG